MIRVQMISRGIPAYQNDFEDEVAAIAAAEVLAGGCLAAKKASPSVDIIRCDIKGGFIRAFHLAA